MAEGDISTAISTAVSTAGDTKWYAGLDAETQNYLAQRGMTDKTPVDAFLEAAKAHREAQAYIGVPKEQLLKMPKEGAPPEEWDAFHERLGWSKDPEAYKFENLKRADGTNADDAFKDFVRTQAAELKLSPAASAKLAEATMKQFEGSTAARTAEETASATRALEQLRQSWGANYDANKVIADNAYSAIMTAAGLDQTKMTAAIQQLGAATGKAEAMQILLAIGQKLGEDTFVGGGGPGGNLGPRNSEQAQARLNELKADGTWVQRFLAGGNAEVKEFNDLSKLAFGDA